MGTRFKPRKDGKIDKPPYRVVEGKKIIRADKTNPDNWATFDVALAAYERREVDAIGFVFTEEDPFFIVDCDEVVDPETGELHHAANQVIHALASYTELSCSGLGTHTIGAGVKPTTNCKSRALGFGLEVYDRVRFAVLTGRQLGTTAGIENRQQELDKLCRKVWPAKKQQERRRGSFAGVGLDDQELLRRARQARTGAQFRALYDWGDTSRHPSQSEADYALLNFLIFWTAGDRERIIRLFKASALYREDKHREYVEVSIANALASYVGSFYKPRSVRKARREEPEDPLTPYLELLLDPSAWRGRKGPSAYKAFAGAVIRGAEYGAFDDNGDLRIGCDTRTLAELAGMRRATLQQSALPYLIREKKLLQWRRGKGRQAGVLVLKNPRERTERTNKVSTHFIGTVSAPPQRALETLRLIIRMRGGHSKHARLSRLGMPAMFVTVAMTAAGVRRGQNIAEIGQRTGRRPRDLREVLRRLKAAGIAREVARDVYRLTDDFAAQYERVLDQSGITYAERDQRRRHDEDRKARDGKLPADKQTAPLRGKEHNSRVLEERRREAQQRWIEEQRQKVGVTAAVFLADEMADVVPLRLKDIRRRWAARGGSTDDLRRAVHFGPWRFKREADGDLYVYPVAQEGT